MHAVRIAVICMTVVAFASAAQQPAPKPAGTTKSAAASPASPARLPVSRVVLYKNGIGYLEHFGRVQGNGEVTVEKALKGSAEERALLQRYTRELDSQEDQLSKLRIELSDLRNKRMQAASELDRIIQEIALEASF